MAFVGEPKVVMLDEPTRGLGPAKLRQTYAFLKKLRADRTILMTSHDVNEACHVGDHIIILSEGVIKCRGSLPFLHRNLSVGYHLLLGKKPDCVVEDVTSAVKELVPTAVFESDELGELSYLIPESEAADMPKLMREIETHLDDLQLEHCKVDAETMEAVFFRLKVDSPSLKIMSQEIVIRKPAPAKNTKKELPGVDIDHKLHGAAACLSKVKGMLVKKGIILWRHKIVHLLLLTLPLVPGIISVIEGRSLMIVEPPKQLTLGTSAIGAYSVTGNCPRNTPDRYRRQFAKTARRNVSDVRGFFKNYLERYGPTQYMKKWWIGAGFVCNSSRHVKITSFFNPQLTHAMPTSLAYTMTAIARAVLEDDSYTITTSNHPMSTLVPKPVTDTFWAPHSMPYMVLLGLASFFVAMALQQFVERFSGAKLLQFALGVTPLSYWLASFVWDLTLHLVLCLATILAIVEKQTPCFSNGWNVTWTFLLLMLYGWACLPTVYCIQLWFSSAVFGMITVILWTLCGVTVTVILDEPPAMARMVVPHLAFYYGMVKIVRNTQARDVCMKYTRMCSIDPEALCCGGCSGDNCVHFRENMLSLSAPGVGLDMLFLLLQGAVFFLITLALDVGYLKDPPRSREPEDYEGTGITHRDQDVIREQDRVKSGHTIGNPIVLRYIGKHHATISSVKSVCLGVQQGECFALLGQDGAGKTTLLRMIAGKEAPTTGDAFVDGRSIRTQRKEAQSALRYCGRGDAVLNDLTAAQMLALVARLRGVPGWDVDRVVKLLLSLVDLEENPHRQLRVCSKSYRRKVSVAVALLGAPDVMLFDEPTAGMDYQSRRMMWNTLSRVRESGRTLLIGTRSLKECEALCTRLALMVNGSFVWLGDPDDLRHKFGEGYVVCIKLVVDEEGVKVHSAPVVAHIMELFPFAHTYLDIAGNVHAEILDSMIPASYLFTELESCKKSLSIADYTVQRATLENVLYAAFRAQIPRTPKSEKDKKCWPRFRRILRK
ncbi:hypothetical protein BaRGS_00004945 [Batillaria attramentaria]|uniref:ABC transporter domain-containing protein n=1 Tax=Batillaria attramentaria TaxID=370345 RepID=A0ABD0LWD5_9CAEN